MQPTSFYVVRHGETAWNLDKRLQGHLDVPLNPTGRRQAEAVGRALTGENFDAAYCSDLRRAQDTAEIATLSLGLTTAPLAALRERHYGAFQGLTHAQAQARFPSEHRALLAREPETPPPGDGETLAAFRDRILAAFGSLARQHAGRRILVFTHGGVLDILYRSTMAIALEAPRDFPIPNAALNRLETDGEHWHLTEWADLRHLVTTLDELAGS